jgi:hypothetical protein
MAKIPVEIIANEALVVRGGRNHPENIQRVIATYPSGITGISVECAVELSVYRTPKCHATLIKWSAHSSYSIHSIHSTYRIHSTDNYQ